MSQRKESVGRWYSVCFCSRCQHRLSRGDMSAPTGRCPHCDAQSAGSVPDYHVRKHRKVTTYRKVLGLFWWPVATRIEFRGE